MLVYKANPIIRSNMKIVRVQKKTSKNSEKLVAPQILTGGWSKEEKKKYKNVLNIFYLGLRDMSSYILRKK
jgi:hypothetical protein